MKAASINIAEQKNKKRMHPVIKITLKAIKVLVALIVLVCFTLAGVVGGVFYRYIQTTEDLGIEQLDIETRGLTSFIYDKDGNIMAQLTGRDNQNREVVSYEEIPEYMEKALVAIEDERFYQHKGVDMRRTATATLYYMTGIGTKHGGSTITQQLLKTLTGYKDETPKRKIQEQWAALKLEKRLDKWQIIAKYLNLIYMGNSCYGVQSASITYFGKNVSELSLAECALLIGIINEPATYNPFTEEGRKAAKKRQEIILAQMLKQGYINEKEYTNAVKSPLVYANPEERKTTTTVQSYFVDQVINDVIKDLSEKYGISSEAAALRLYNNGYKVYTTQDPEIQKVLDDEFNNEEHFWKDNREAIQYGELPQAAMVIIDPYTGEVLAMYGGAGKKTGSRTFNRATQLKRHAGSSIKPIAVYGPALDLHLITPVTVIDDIPVRMHTEEDLKEELYPVNFTKDYLGLTDIRTAIVQSINVVAAKVWRDILGPDSSIEYLKKVGIDREKEKYVSLALGGLEEGVSPLNMASAFCTFPNRGVYIKPRTYTMVVDENGKVLLDNKPVSTVVYEESTAWLMVDMLRDVTRPGGTASYCIIGDGKSIPTAGKTGTSSYNIDKWFVGFTPYYVAATWYGYDNTVAPISIQEGEERMKVQRIWQAVMEGIHEGLEPREFQEPPPSSIEKRYICRYSGKVASDLCYKDPRGDAVRLENFIKGTAPAYDDLCDVHITAKVCMASTDIWNRPLLAREECPEEFVEERVFFQRFEPYVPEMPDNPYPLDWIYDLPAGEYCTAHGIDEDEATDIEEDETVNTEEDEAADTGEDEAANHDNR